jgi:fructokinase
MFKGHHFVSDLATALGAKAATIHTENDANCFALAEVFFGAGMLFEKETKIPRRQQIGIGVIIGTGTGSGIVVEGRILRGARGAGGEVGHITLHEGGDDCYCGRKGCAEQYLSGPALKAHGGDLKAYVKDLGLFLGQLTNAFDPHWFVLGGGVSKESVIYQEIDRMIEPHLFIKQRAPRVYKHQISDDAGLLGAALLGVG